MLSVFFPLYGHIFNSQVDFEVATQYNPNNYISETMKNRKKKKTSVHKRSHDKYNTKYHVNGPFYFNWAGRES